MIILIIVILCWPLITKWFRQFLARRTEDYLRKATGMPPRPGSREEKKQRKAARQANSEERDESEAFYGRRRRSQRRSRRNPNEPIIPPEYAEDVEFVETIDYSDTKIGENVDTNPKEYHESQVTDVEWVEVKKKA